MWRYFKRENFACRHCGENRQQTDFVDQLDELRARCGFPLIVTSGYRCPVHNSKVSSTGTTGPHTTGRAVDFGVDREKATTVLALALAMPVFRGFGVNQKGASGRFIHLDAINRPTRTIWSY